MPQIIYGTVKDDGAISGGEGYRSSSPKTGAYDITFDKPFGAPPCVVATMKDWGADNQIIVKNITTSKCEVWIYDLEVVDGKLIVREEKSGFNFIAIGAPA